MVIPKVFNNPVAWTKNAPFFKGATMADQTARSWLKDQISDGAAPGTPAGKYLVPQIMGGTRPHTPFENRLIRKGVMRSDEYAVPGTGVVLNSSGDIPKAILTVIYEQILNDQGVYTRITKGGKKGKGKQGSAIRYFVSSETGPTLHLKRGIYQARVGADGRYVRQIIRFVFQAPFYRERYDFHATADQVIDNLLISTWEREWLRAMATGP